MEDNSSTRVIEWLEHYKEKYIRISETTKIENVFIDFSVTDRMTCCFSINGEIINIEDVKSVWIRRGDFKLNYPYKLSKSRNINRFMEFHYENDLIDLRDCIFNELLEYSFVLGTINLQKVNKLTVLKAAQRLGLKTPSWFITGRKQDIENVQNQRKLVMKGISETLEIPAGFKEEGFKWYTTPLEIKVEQDSFWPTVFQESLNKQFDLRILYVDDTFFATAIFPSKDKNNIDFRKEDHSNLIYLPFVLPNHLKEKLSNLMQSIGLNFGSIDMVCNSNSEFYFLEVNPMGQYDYYAWVCNYNVDQFIAKTLCGERTN